MRRNWKIHKFRRYLTYATSIWTVVAVLSACKPRTSSDLQDASSVSTHYWSEGEYYFRGECAEGQAPSRSCVNNLSSLLKKEIAEVQKRLSQVDKEKGLLKELGLESVLLEADKLQENYSSKIRLLSDLSNPAASRELLSEEEQDFIDKLFKGKAAFLDIKSSSLSVSETSVCAITSNSLVICRYPGGQKWEGSGSSVKALTNGSLIVEPHNGGSIRLSNKYIYPDRTRNLVIPKNVFKIFLSGLFCVTFGDQTSQLNLACYGRFYSDQGFVPTDTVTLGNMVIYSFSRVLARAQRSLKVAGGFEHLCSVADESALFCEGVNQYGQLGTGDLENRGQRVAVLKDVIDVAAGRHHTCAVQKGGALRCWGQNTEGQLGHINPGIKATDEKAVVMQGVRRVAADFDSTCAILDNKELHCWGSIPTQFIAGQAQAASEGHPANVKTNFIQKDVLDVAMSMNNICMSIEKAGVKCWGDNQHGLLDTEDQYYGDQPGETLDKLPAVFKYEGTPK